MRAVQAAAIVTLACAATCVRGLASPQSARSDETLLRGSVRLADNTPWAGAQVVAEATDGAAAERRARVTTKTDTRGRYTLPLEPGLSYRLFAWSRHGERIRFAGPREYVKPGRARPLQAWPEELSEPRLRIRGLDAWTGRGDMRLLDARGDALEQLPDGSYRFRPHPLRKRHVSLVDGRGLPVLTRNLSLNPGENDVRIDPPSKILVRVTLGKRKAQKFRVRLPFAKDRVRYLDAPATGLELTCAMQDGVIPGLRLTVLPDGSPETRIDLGEFTPRKNKEGRSELHVALGRGLPIGGRVVSKSESVAGRRLYLWAACNRVHDAYGDVDNAWLRGVPIDCEDDGSFRSSAILERGYGLYARLAASEKRALDDGTPVAPLALIHASRLRSRSLACSLDDLATVRVHVVDHRGRAVRHAELVIAGEGNGEAGGPRFGCDPRGRLAIRIRKETLLTIAAASVDATAIVQRRIHGDARIEIRLRQPIVLEGRLLDDDDQGVPGVRFELDEFNLQNLLFGDSLLGELPPAPGQTTDARGRFRIRLPGPSRNLTIHPVADRRLDHAELDRIFGSLSIDTVDASRRGLEWRLSDF